MSDRRYRRTASAPVSEQKKEPISVSFIEECTAHYQGQELQGCKSEHSTVTYLQIFDVLRYPEIVASRHHQQHSAVCIITTSTATAAHRLEVLHGGDGQLDVLLALVSACIIDKESK